MSQELLTIVTRKGQITVPASIRRALKIRIGDKIALSLREGTGDEVILRPVRSVAAATYAVVPARPRPVGLEDLRDQFEEGLAEDALKGLSPAPEP